ncbi:hypothetical protein [Parasphingopyxis marina]|uniref:Uncharacterized protein n=1 Tax=Parasphingopyxis marina TaxID=2761622 RepID=A0A842HTP3_9SPHN|nr:hypothetical protein [Parasphingopyxis marina]MBC2777298.1 hypothetical protein [Parasphingopyxis marina]
MTKSIDTEKAAKAAELKDKELDAVQGGVARSDLSASQQAQRGRPAPKPEVNTDPAIKVGGDDLADYVAP